ncbi:MAG: sulfotransferase, partial [Coleofasciculaceae cyanobacterium]
MSVPQPIFILGAPRSFTSVICAMLGQHPETYGVPELNLFIDETLDQLTQRLKGIRQFQLHGLLRTVAQLYAGEQTILSVDMA